MNAQEKLLAKTQLEKEQQVLKDLKAVYRKALKDVQANIAGLNARTDMQNIQSIIYQKRYQEALEQQIKDILDDLNNNNFTTIDQYIRESYDNGYIGQMWKMQKETGVTMVMPIDQKKVMRAYTNDTKLVSNYYKANPVRGRVAENLSLLKKRVRSNVSRGIAAGMTWTEVAYNIASGMKNSFDKAMNDAMRIARTEGHRVNQQGYLDAGETAKNAGADCVKQWDSTLDGLTRPWHREADGQIRELDDDFIVDGEKMKAPSVGGSARNVCNCRCQLLIRARWALDEDELKTLQDRAAFFGLDKTDSFNEFKEKYLQLSEEAANLGVEELFFRDLSGTTTKLKQSMNDSDYTEFMEIVQRNPNIAPLYEYADELKTLMFSKSEGYYQHNQKKLVFSYPAQQYIDGGKHKFSTVSHEYGHFFDRFTYKGLNFNEYSQIAKIIQTANNDYVASSSDEFLSAMRADAKDIKADLTNVKNYCVDHMHATSGVQDAIDGLGYGRINWGHGDKYYNRFYSNRIKNKYFDCSKEVQKLYKSLGLDASNQAKVKRIARHYETASELWANITACVTTGGEELEHMKKVFPKAVETYLNIIGKVETK